MLHVAGRQCSNGAPPRPNIKRKCMATISCHTTFYSCSQNYLRKWAGRLSRGHHPHRGKPAPHHGRAHPRTSCWPIPLTPRRNGLRPRLASENMLFCMNKKIRTKQVVIKNVEKIGTICEFGSSSSFPLLSHTNFHF